MGVSLNTCHDVDYDFKNKKVNNGKKKKIWFIKNGLLFQVDFSVNLLAFQIYMDLINLYSKQHKKEPKITVKYIQRK